jgi:hypothetical protein
MVDKLALERYTWLRLKQQKEEPMKRKASSRFPSSQQEHPASAAQQWMNEQPYDVLKAARNVKTPPRDLLDIARHGTAMAREYLCSNKSSTMEVLSTIASKRPSEPMMQMMACNPNCSSSTLGKLAFQSKGQNTLTYILSHKNLSLMLAARYLPNQNDYNYDGPSYYISNAITAGANPVVPFELLLKHISYYREDQINYIVGHRSQEFKNLIKPYQQGKKDHEAAMGRLINLTLFGTADDADIMSDWYNQLLDADSGNPHALAQLKEAAARWL